MFQIEELMNLFQDNQEAQKIIFRTYNITQKQNKKLSDTVFRQLQYLKTLNQSIQIKVNYESSEPSNFNLETNTIYLNGLFEETTFIHELTHMFSYYYSRFYLPEEYKSIKEKFHSDWDNDSTIISFLELCKKEKEKLLNSDLAKENEYNIKDVNINQNQSKDNYFIIIKIEDIIDSLYGGKSHDQGLRYTKDNESYTEKSTQTAGHGCDYFSKTGYDFEEILANYQAIKMIAPNNDLFLLLKQILGKEFIVFLDERCRLINGVETFDIDINNNITK